MLAVTVLCQVSCNDCAALRVFAVGMQHQSLRCLSWVDQKTAGESDTARCFVLQHPEAQRNPIMIRDVFMPRRDEIHSEQPPLV